MRLRPATSPNHDRPASLSCTKAGTAPFPLPAGGHAGHHRDAGLFPDGITHHSPVADHAPLGLLLLLAWRLLRPDLWRAWIGLPLGLFDDVMSGQPIGSAMFLWTVALMGIDAIEHRMVWRSYRQDWLIATLAIIFCIAGGLFFARITGGGNVTLFLVAPQMVWTILLFPFVVRQCARIDRWRVMA